MSIRSQSRRRLFAEALEERRVLTAFPFAVGGVGWSVDTDNAGHVFLAGQASASDDLDPGEGTAFLAGGGTLAKYTPDGEFQWARSIGAHVMSVEVDSVGNTYAVAYFTGNTQISGLDRLGNGANATYSGPSLTSHSYTQGNGKKTKTQTVYQQDVVVVKFDPAGVLQWTAQIGGDNGTAFANRMDIHLDTEGIADGIYFTGQFSGTVDFDPGAGTQEQVSSGLADAFIAKLDGQGNLVWSAQAGGAGNDLGRGVAVAEDGSSYFTGYFAGTNPFGPSFPMAATGTTDAFVAKFDSGGNIQWVNNISPDIASSTEIILVGQDIYVSGRTDEIYGSISKLNSDGSLEWSKTVGEGTDLVAPWGVAVDDTGDLYLYGYYGGGIDSSVDFDPGEDEYLLPDNTGDTGFVVKLDAGGNFGGWATRVGSHVRNAVYDSQSSTLVLTGHYGSGTLEISTRDTSGGVLPTGSGGFLAKLNVVTGLPPGLEPNDPPLADAGVAQSGNEDQSVTFDASGSSDPENDPLTYLWDFGDGQTAQTTSPTVNHTYAFGGAFTVTLTVLDGHGNQSVDTTSATIVEVNDVPVANIGNGYAGYESQPVHFDASASVDFDNVDGTSANDQVLTYYWDFGDGNSATTSVAAVDHVYAEAGSYQASLVIDDGLVSSLASHTTVAVTVAPVDNSNKLYVYDIRFDSRKGGKEWRAVFEIRRDSDAGSSSGDAVVADVTIEVTFAGVTYTGTTDSNGVFRTNWRSLAKGTYQAEVVALAHSDFFWSLYDNVDDLEDDSDGDGLPDAFLTF